MIFSHSSSRAVNDVVRNVPDDILKLLPRNGGVVMVTFVPGFLSPKVTAWNKLQTRRRGPPEAADPGDAAAVKAGVDAWTKANPSPRATVADVADHIDHIKQVAGIDHIGLGGDFDGITAVPLGLEDVSTYPVLTAELLRRGYSDDDMRKILGAERAARDAAGREGGEEAAGRARPVDAAVHEMTRARRRGSWRSSPLARRAPSQRTLDDDRIVIVALGDSTTAGTPAFRSPIEAPPDGAETRRASIAYWLMRAHPEWDVLNRGVNGERSDEIATRFDRDVVAAAPAVVI